MTTPTKRILLGRILGAHGVRGEVRVIPYTERPQGIGSYGPLSDERGTRSFRLKVVRSTPKGVIARVEGVSDRTAAEALKGTALYVPREKLPPPADGEFYHEDLVGLRAQAPDGTQIGTVAAVANYGAGDLLEIARTDGKPSELVPFKDAFVPVVDVAGGYVVVIFPVMDDSSDEPDAAEPD